VSRKCPSCGGSCGYTKRKGCQYNSPANEYKRRNPLGGVAKVFEAVASRIRAGNPLAATMEDFGLMWTKDLKQAETRAWWIVCHGRGRMVEHNAIADYRQIDPDATISELIERPK
jgi:hypothetical protein